MSTTLQTAAPAPPIDALDLLRIDDQLSDEERLIRDTVRAFVATGSCRTSATGSRRACFPPASSRRSSASSACWACT